MTEAIAGKRIIGGMFGFEDVPDSSGAPPAFLHGSTISLVNGRSALSLLVDLLSPERTWMPSYLCYSMLDGIGDGKTRIEFYEVDYDLRASRDWINNVGSGDLVILIDYFGWPCDPSLVKGAQQQGAYVLEDAAQSMLSEQTGKFADLVLYSPRKFVGVPDGAILQSKNPSVTFDDVELLDPPYDWWLQAYNATLLRREYDTCGDSGRWFDLYRSMDKGHPIGNYAMGQLTKFLLTRGFDYAAIAHRRIENCRYLTEELRDIAMFADIEEGVVPLGFPVRMSNRDQIRQALFAEGIYPPLHWPIADIIPKRFDQSHALSRDIMTLPCDHRYDCDDMRRMAGIITSELRE